MNQRKEESEMSSNNGLFDILNLSELRNLGCPFCWLFVSEVGILNAAERDLAIFLLHNRKDHAGRQVIRYI
jgi:hypothetical protein